MNRAPGVSFAVVAVLCCFVTRGICQDTADINKGCFYDGDGDKAARVLMDLIDCSGSGGQAADVCQDTCGPAESYCESDSGMTVGICQNLCRAGNFQYYGLQTGSQCFCGGAFSNPTVYGMAPSEANCSETCTGNVSQTCGGEFRLRIYEFQDPVVTPGCFFPASVPYATVEDVGVGVGETLTFSCQPGYELVGEPSLTCAADRIWSPAVVPSCNYTGIFPETTTEAATTTVETTAIPSTTSGIPFTETMPRKTTTAESRPTAPATTVRPVVPTTVRPVVPTTAAQRSIADILPYIIGGSVALAILLVIGIIVILSCRVRKRGGGGARDIRLKPDDIGPVTFLNRGYVGGEEPDMPNARTDVHLATLENEYVIHGSSQNGHDDDVHNGELAKAGGTDRTPGTNSISPNSDPAIPNGVAAPELSPNALKPPEHVHANVTSADDLDSVSDEATSHENISGKIKWDSQENLISDNVHEDSSRL